MIDIIVTLYVRPRLLPASNCPLSTDIIPLLSISATYAPELTANARTATRTLSTFTDLNMT